MARAARPRATAESKIAHEFLKPRVSHGLQRKSPCRKASGSSTLRNSPWLPGQRWTVAVLPRKTHFGAGAFGRSRRFALAKAPRENRTMTRIFRPLAWQGERAGRRRSCKQSQVASCGQDACEGCHYRELWRRRHRGIGASASSGGLLGALVRTLQAARAVLEQIVKAAGGKVKLVKMNIDEHPEIPGRLGVRSIPAVIAFQRGQPVDGFMGALPERDLRASSSGLPARSTRVPIAWPKPRPCSPPATPRGRLNSTPR